MVMRREVALTFCCELIATVLLRRLGVRPKALWTCNGILGCLHGLLVQAGSCKAHLTCNRATGATERQASIYAWQMNFKCLSGRAKASTASDKARMAESISLIG